MEYEEFTSKLHDFSVKEQQLKEKLRLQNTLSDSDVAETTNGSSMNNELVPNSPASFSENLPSSNNQLSRSNNSLLLDSPLSENLGNSNSSSQPSSACVPKSPIRAIVRAHLGDHGHTFVVTKPGITVRDALSRAMKLRKLTPETCAVYNCSDPSKVNSSSSSISSSVNWKKCIIILCFTSRNPSHGTWTFPRSMATRSRWKCTTFTP